MSSARIHLMSLSEVEFFRILPVAVTPCRYTVAADTVVVQCPQGMAHIRISAEAPRRIASLSFPVLKVAIEFTEMSEPESQAFLERFDRAFHRGGG